MLMEPITLTDAATGSSAKILSGLGFNCYSFQPMFGDQPIEVLWSEADFPAGQCKPSHSGIPILFPFPGRLRGSHLAYEGQTYPLGSDDGRGNAIHGFVLNRPWRIVESLPHRAVGEFHASLDEPGLIRRWPNDFRMTVAYELSGNTLSAEIEVQNPGPARLPFGLGLHPYFRLPLGPGDQVDACRVTVPVSEYWELSNMLPTGRRLPADGPRALAGGMSFSQMQLDDVLTGLSVAAGRCLATVEDPRSGHTLELSFDASFRECVVYNPPHREAVCIEPYTCVPDAYELQAAGIVTGLRFLQPGEVFQTRFEITVR